MSCGNNFRRNYSSNRDRMVWVDLEMTGLNVDTDQIIEIACLVTDADLNIVAEGPNLVIHQPKAVLDAMNDWCKEHHGKSGLTDAVRKSQTSLSSAESQVLGFLSTHTSPGVCPLAGNSIHVDRMFLSKYMPRLTSHLHYRIVDVSTIKELCRRWHPKQFEAVPQKQLCHRALDDIKESVEELKYYRKSIFVN